ncbi:hypothetical protein CEXT_662611 [Caerostris extrusa]|uniref:Uncharacterized protein n=1 Tax=Caerostris extrusa TaxID=172846 RepID=A0AAV4VBU5_CAEEX|nr:hypothetical protein CEXT_662611 [Caerostris extrusa]
MPGEYQSPLAETPIQKDFGFHGDKAPRHRTANYSDQKSKERTDILSSHNFLFPKHRQPTVRSIVSNGGDKCPVQTLMCNCKDNDVHVLVSLCGRTSGHLFAHPLASTPPSSIVRG